MSQTPVSGSASYCTPADSLSFCDARRVGQYVSDSGKAVAPVDLTTNATWTGFLQAASGEIESECFVGGRYSTDDLANLSTASQRSGGGASNSEMLLRMLVAYTAFTRLLERRGVIGNEADKANATWAAELRTKLRKGEAIFGFQQAVEADRVEADFMDDDNFGTLGLSSDQANRFFGVRAKHTRPMGRF